MQPETREEFDKVRRYSGLLSTLFIIALILAVLAGLVGIPVSLFIGQVSLDDGTVVNVREFGIAVRVLAAIGTVAGVAIFIKQLMHLHKLFALYADGEIFTASNVRQIRGIGVSFLLFACVWVYFAVLRILAATAFDAPGAADWLVGLEIGGDNPIGNLVMGLIVMIASWIMDVGREMREEQDLTV